MASVEAVGLGKAYGGTTVLQGVSFQVRPGRVTGFLGPNGAGKTTTMRLMLGLTRGSGRTTFDGQEYERLSRPLTRVGAVLDTNGHHPARRAEDHLRMVAAGAGLPRHRVREVLDMVGLGRQARDRPGSFSLGMHQRLGIATALLGSPDTLILDEPSNGLDPQGIAWLNTFLRAYVDDGNSVLLSSHLLTAMQSLVDDVLVISEGRLVMSGPLSDLIDAADATVVAGRCDDSAALLAALSAAGLQATVHADGAVVVRGDDARRVAAVASGAGLLLWELAVRRPSLEIAYLAAARPAAAASDPFSTVSTVGVP